MDPACTLRFLRAGGHRQMTRSLRSESISPSGLVTSRKKFARSQNQPVFIARISA